MFRNITSDLVICTVIPAQAGTSLLYREAEYKQAHSEPSYLHRHPGICAANIRDLMTNIEKFGEKGFCLKHVNLTEVPGSAIRGPGMTVPLIRFEVTLGGPGLRRDDGANYEHLLRFET
jgi:hypothetical protein